MEYYNSAKTHFKGKTMKMIIRYIFDLYLYSILDRSPQNQIKICEIYKVVVLEKKFKLPDLRFCEKKG